MSAAASTNSIANPDVKETKQRRKPEASSRDLHTGGFSPVSKATEIPRGKEQVTFKKPAVPSKRFQVSHSKAKPKEQTNTTASKKPKSIIAPKLGSERVSKRRPLMAAFRTMPSTSGTAKSTPKTGLERPSEGKTAEHAAPKTTPATTSLDHRQSLGQGATKAPSKAARKQMVSCLYGSFRRDSC